MKVQLCLVLFIILSDKTLQDVELTTKHVQLTTTAGGTTGQTTEDVQLTTTAGESTGQTTEDVQLTTTTGHTTEGVNLTTTAGDTTGQTTEVVTPVQTTEQTTINSTLLEDTLPPCEATGKIANLKITSVNYYDMSLSWDPPDPTCLSTYAISLDDEPYGETTDTSFTIRDLNACQEYNISVENIADDATGGKEVVSETTTKPPPDEGPYSISDITLSSPEADTIKVSWSEPNKIIAKCITSYKIVWWGANVATVTKNTKELFYEITPVIGCRNYNIMVTPLMDNNEGQGPTKEYTAEGTVQNPPISIKADPGQTSVSIEWQTDTKEKNMCEIVSIYVICEAPDDLNKPLDWIEKNVSDTFKVSESANSRYTTNLTKLSPFTNYTCKGVVKNSVGDSSPSNNISIKTNEAVPNAPRFQITSIKPTQFKVTWLEPTYLPGVMKFYHIIIKEIKSLYTIRDECFFPESSTNQSMTPDQFEFIFSGAYPYFEYTVSVDAEDGAGRGEAQPQNFTTEPDVPEKPSNFNGSEPIVDKDPKCNDDNPDESCFNYIAQIPISWTLPCKINGVIKEFLLMITGEHTNVKYAINSTDTKTIIPIIPNQIDYSCNISNLKASYNYSVSLQVVIQDEIMGEEATLSFISPDGYPGQPNLIKFQNDVNNDNIINAEWEEPLMNMGTILNYTITISVESLHYILETDGCPVIDKSPKIITDNIKKYDYDRALPDFTYSAFVFANTRPGSGPKSNVLTYITPSRQSEPVRDLISDQTYKNSMKYEGKCIVTFKEPCNTNGHFTEYQFSYVGERAGYPPHENKYPLKETTHDFDLKPDYDYKITVSVATDKFVSSEEYEIFHSRAGVPSFTSTFKDPLVNSSNQAYFSFSKSDFSEENGAIVYYSLMLLRGRAQNNESTFNFWNEEVNATWPQVPSNIDGEIGRQITPKNWLPFENGSDVNFVIGEVGNCSEWFCNELLHENTDYVLIVRALTRFTYIDSAPIKFKTDEVNTLNLALILGLTFGILALILILGFIGFLWWRSRQNFSKDTNLSLESYHAPVPCEKYLDYYQKLTDHFGLAKSQFSILEQQAKSLALPITYAVFPENSRKNRYTNILPYDATRVKLNIDEDDEIASDYINASFITGYSGAVEYIATQGPLAGTCKDFWNMIVQQNVTVIVMVTQFVEQNKEKCYQYFPNNHETKTFGDNWNVQCRTELNFGTYCIRTLQINQNDVEQRSVVHIQFLDWPDFGIPSSTDFTIQFVRQIRTRIKSEGGLMALHCSAGVGRTGTLIALDMLFQTIDDHKDIDVFQVVMDLRKQRINMVQTDKQFFFIHTCIKDLLLDNASTLLTSEKNKEHLYTNLMLENEGSDILVKDEESAL